MDTQNPADTQQDKIVEPTLDVRVNEALNKVDEKGKLVFEEGVDPLFKALVVEAKKARDHQAAFTKSRQEIADLKAKKDLLEAKVKSNSTQLSPEQVEELEDLKFTDPDAWFAKKLKYENEAKAKFNGQLDEQLVEASTKALMDLTLAERTEMLKSFQAQTGIVLTDDVMANDIPPRIQSKINTMPFEDYLQEVATYLKTGKVVKNTDEGLDITNLSNLAGSSITNGRQQSKYQII